MEFFKELFESENDFVGIAISELSYSFSTETVGGMTQIKLYLDDFSSSGYEFVGFYLNLIVEPGGSDCHLNSVQFIESPLFTNTDVVFLTECNQNLQQIDVAAFRENLSGISESGLLVEINLWGTEFDFEINEGGSGVVVVDNF